MYAIPSKIQVIVQEENPVDILMMMGMLHHIEQILIKQMQKINIKQIIIM
jgi:hypothetical protein